MSRTVPVNARLCVSYLVQAGNFESGGIPSLSFVHVIPKGQNHLQELTQRLAMNNLLARKIQSCNHTSKERKSCTLQTILKSIF